MHFKNSITISIRIIYTAILFFLSSTGAKAQDVKKLTLKDAIVLSVKNSNQLHASEARMDQAAAFYKQSLDNRLPNATVSASYLRLIQPTISLKTKAFGNTGDTSGGGGKMPSVNQAMYGIANISLPLFAGGKIRYGIESARYLKEAASLDADNDKQGVIINTINAFTNLYKAGATIKVVEENLSQSRHRDSVFSRLEQNGLLARNDLLKAQLQTANISLSLLDAQSNLKLALLHMNLMLGLAENTELNVDESGFQKVSDLKTLSDYEGLAFLNRKDNEALVSRQKAAGVAISLARAERSPSLAITGGYVAADVPHLITITNAVNAGIGLQYNIASLWKSRAHIAEAQSKEKEIMANEENLKDAIKIEVATAYENYLLGTKKLDVYKSALIQSEENYRITKNKYDNALVNTTDLLDANVLLLQAKMNIAVAEADVYVAYSKLLYSTGTLN